ncbi:uncharacterized protein RMCC_0885 [Mycolicibacterium canariasense]|uniref:Uncharacterized protein n=1 Tax=Mycolicibacterium canariasense TaxID=228230 RepID=A0A117I8Y7_MYCCR|nr:uncharacterized protein RMCC_0885 [Mycolicibacterium canariasense]
MDELGDIGLGVGTGFIYGAIDAEVQDGVHCDDPFGSFSWTGAPISGAVTKDTRVTIEVNDDNDPDNSRCHCAVC